MAKTDQNIREVLLKEYESRNSYNKLYIEAYEKHTNYLSLYFTIFFGLIGYLFSEKDVEVFFNNRNQATFDKQYFYLSILLFLIILLYYLLAYMLDKLYLIYINASRIKVLEKKINQLIGSELLVYEEKLIPYFYATRWIFINDFIKPPYLISIWVSLIVYIYSFLICLLCYVLVSDLVYFFTLFTFFFSTLMLYQFYAINTTGVKIINEHNEYISGSSRKGPYVYSINKPILIPILTIMFGILSFSILSIKENTFFTTSEVEYPLLALPTIYIGDLFFLPIINYKVGKLILENKKRIGLLLKKTGFKIGLLIIIAISVIFNLLTHSIWKSDEFDSFMDMNHELTNSGIIHLIFSIVNMGIILLIILISGYLLYLKETLLFQKVLNIWKYVIGFTSLSILDFFYRFYNVNVHNQSFGIFIKNNPFSFGTITFSLVVLFVFKSLGKRYLNIVNLKNSKD